MKKVSVQGKRFILEKYHCCEVKSALGEGRVTGRKEGDKRKENKLQVAMEHCYKVTGSGAEKDFLCPLDTVRISGGFLRGRHGLPRE